MLLKIALCDSQNRDGMKPTGNVISVKNKLYVARRIAGSSLGIEIYRFEVSKYHIGENVTFVGLFFLHNSRTTSPILLKQI